MRSKLSYANVTATLALFIALGGGAYAATQLEKNSVDSQTIRNGQVKGVDVAEKTLGTVPKAKQADKMHGLRTYRVAKAFDEGDALVTIWKHGSFRIKGRCYTPSMTPNTQGTINLGSPKPGVDLSAVAGREGQDEAVVYANDNADGGDYGTIALAIGLNQFPSTGNTSFAATLPAANGNPKETVSGNLIILARHQATGKDCSVSGQVSTG